ncbi:glycosyl hydrolase [Marinifilum caeruleilacunae]|jgi:exo-beta-1,3-glucanase (GH17 family)|uniref:glycoside hydrolase family 17 protein n=1 Tax=Marinifilum caeruleilacunae TaxID=2499076 RepID=UPI0014922483|nr:glycosyl hydrolase [Marinifilum caeruleilacunae]
MKKITEELNIKFDKAICYSGFREGQSPDAGIFPSYEQIKEDLLILQGHWKYLRLYACDEQTDTVLEVIRNEKLDFQVMLGAYIGAEMNNFACPWGGVYSEGQLIANKEHNINQIEKLIQLANQYSDIVFALSAGNEATVSWTDHYVPVESVIRYVNIIKKGAKQPVTFCENYVPWLDHIKDLVEAVDFISIHTYPVWEYKNIHEALEYTKQNYYSIAEKYPHKPVVITEAGWATNSNGRGIDPGNVSEDFQSVYYQDLMKWTEEEEILCFYFEAFDESWKGSPEPMEPEKHWGLFTLDRKPKKVMENQFAELMKA